MQELNEPSENQKVHGGKEKEKVVQACVTIVSIPQSQQTQGETRW